MNNGVSYEHFKAHAVLLGMGFMGGQSSGS